MRLLLATALALCTLLPAPQALCAYCSQRPCRSAETCREGCVCLRSGPEPGYCVSLQAR
jgi:hypothetical protein